MCLKSVTSPSYFVKRWESSQPSNGFLVMDMRLRMLLLVSWSICHSITALSFLFMQSRRQFGRGITTVLQNYTTTVFHTYIRYNDLKHKFALSSCDWASYRARKSYLLCSIIFSRVLCDSIPRFVHLLVGWSVGWTVGWSVLRLVGHKS